MQTCQDVKYIERRRTMYETIKQAQRSIKTVSLCFHKRNTRRYRQWSLRHICNDLLSQQPRSQPELL